MPVFRASDSSPDPLSRRRIAGLAILLVTLCGCSGSAGGGHASGTATSEVTAAATAIPPLSSQAPLPSAAPAVASAAPVPMPAGSPRELVTAGPVATARPASAILSVSSSSSVVHAGGSVLWTVRTTPDVTSVSVSTPLVTLPMNRSAPGLFQLSFGIPAQSPAFFHGNYTLSIVGTTASGHSVSSSLDMNFE